MTAEITVTYAGPLCDGDHCKGASLTIVTNSGRKVRFVVERVDEWPACFDTTMFAEIAEKIDDRLARMTPHDPWLGRRIVEAILEYLDERERGFYNTWRGFHCKEFELMENLKKLTREWQSKLKADPEMRQWFAAHKSRLPPSIALSDPS